jgi:hypothetical protein
MMSSRFFLFMRGDDPQSGCPDPALPVEGATLAGTFLMSLPFYEGEAPRTLFVEGATLAPIIA